MLYVPKLLALLLLLHVAHADLFSDLVKKGNAAANQQRHAESLQIFSEALKLQPNNIPVLRTSADLAHALGQNKESMDFMLRIIGINGQDKDHKTWSDLSDMLASSGDYGRAATCIDNAIKIKPKKAVYHFKKGNYFHALGDDATSVKAHREAVRIKPTYFEAWNNLGTSYMSLTEFQNAISVLRKALELVPGHVTPLFNLALMETRTCDWSQINERRKSLSGALEDAVKTGNHLVIPFHAFEFGYTPQEIKLLSRLYTSSAVLRPIQNMLPGHDFKNKLPSLAEGSKLVVAYLSATGFQVMRVMPVALFAQSPRPLQVSATTVRALHSYFGLHDKTKFDVVCYSGRAGDDSPERNSIVAGCNKGMIDISQLRYDEVCCRPCDRLCITKCQIIFTA
jgi:tetratricopeptide (TPR) repeat protein